MTFKEYHRAVRFLESLGNLRDKKVLSLAFNFKKSERLIRELKIDLDQFKFIHIAGTSGKGSVTAMTHNILLAAGKKVGSSYSPHITTPVERIKVNNKYISPSDWVRLLNKIKPAWEKIYSQDKKLRPNFATIIFALALLYFQEQKCEYVVFEAFVGGENDVTNIIKKPLVTAITNIGLDHTTILGKTLPEIARAKAGIIKPKVPIVTAEKNPRLIKIFKARARRLGSPFIRTNGDNAFYLRMNGSRQNLNANLAAQIGKLLKIDNQTISEGIKNTKLPCRMEIIQRNPLVVVDGAHNADKIKSTIESLGDFNYKKMILITAINENKDIKKIIRTLATKTDQVFITRHLNPGRACADLKLMYNLFLDINKKIKAEIAIDPWQALERALLVAKKDDLVLITGSFFLAGELRKKWISEDQILKDNS